MTVKDLKAGDIVLWNPSYKTEVKDQTQIGIITRIYKVKRLSYHETHYSIDWSDGSRSEEVDSTIKKMLQLKLKFMEQ